MCLTLIHSSQIRLRSHLNSLRQSFATKENSLVSGEILKSVNGQYVMKLDDDGVLSISNNSKEIRRLNPKSTGVGSFKLILREDGNVEMYDSKEKIVWETNTRGKGTSPFRLRLQDNGILALLDANNVVTWSSESSTPSPSPSQPLAIARARPTVSWISCSQERGNCSFKGARIVRYGANDKYFYRMASNSIACNNKIFGDPVVGVVKRCEYFDTDLIWNECSKENGNCKFQGTSVIRYGANGRYSYTVSSDSINCSNRVFGDPIFGVVKACFYSEPINATSNNWKKCAKENSKCNFTGQAVVRYGANGAFYYRRVSNGINCNNLEFGDPLVGTVKNCEYLQ